MADFIFVTSNKHKVQTAKAVCDKFGIKFIHKNMDLLEIQSDNGEDIAKYKVEQAFASFNSAVTVTDDSWIIPGLRGFPGPYMKYMNQWLMPEDFLRLTSELKDRSIIMRHIIAYKDNEHEKIFSADLEGTLLKEVRGKSIIPHFGLISFDGGKHSVAEYESGSKTAISDIPNAWHQVTSWLNSR